MSDTKDTKLDLTDAAAKVRERIELAFLEVMTKEQWEALIVQELRRFTEPQPDRSWPNASGERMLPSKLNQLCQTTLEGMAREEVKRLFSENTNWHGGVSKLVQSWMTDNADKILEVAVRGMIQDGAQGVVNRITFR